MKNKLGPPERSGPVLNTSSEPYCVNNTAWHVASFAIKRRLHDDADTLRACLS